MLLRFLIPYLIHIALIGIALGAHWPWDYHGYDTFPSYFFGARNGTDPREPDSALSWITKHEMVGYGWQHALWLMKEEQALQEVAQQTKEYSRSHRSDGLAVPTFVYRDAQCPDKEYVLAARILDDPTKNHWFLRSVNGTVCRRYGQFADTPQWNFSVSEVRDYYVGVIIEEVAKEKDVDIVFFDETDWTFHHYPWNEFTNCPNFDPFPTDAAWGEYREVKGALLARVAVELNKHHKIPMFASSSISTAESLTKCPKNIGHWAEEDYMETIRLTGGQYIRYYEFWMGGGELDPDCRAALLKNAIWETSQKLPFAVHFGTSNDTDAWLEFGMATFLMAQGDYCYFGASTGWYDRNWSYHPQYDWKIGAPSGPSAQTGNYTWVRKFEHCTVRVDVERGAGTFEWH